MSLQLITEDEDKDLVIFSRFGQGTKISNVNVKDSLSITIWIFKQFVIKSDIYT